MKSPRESLVMLRIDSGGFRRITVACLITVLILPVYLIPHLASEVAAPNDRDAAISEVQASAFEGTLLIFDGHTHDRSVNRMAYFLSEVVGGNQSISFIQFLVKPPPPQDAGRRIMIQGQKVIRPEDNLLIIRATSFTVLDGPTSTQTTTQASTTSTTSAISGASTTSPFDYSISISPTSITLQPEQTATYAVSVALVRGPTQPVSLGWKSNSGLSTGMSVSINPVSGNPPYAATLVVTTTNQATAGTYDLTVHGLAPSVGLAHDSQSVTLVVLPTTSTITSATTTSSQSTTPAFAFTISNNGGITAAQGGSGSNTISVSLLSGTSQLVSLSCTSGLPAGASCGFSPQSGNPNYSSTLTISTSPSTPTGSYTVTVTGTGGGNSHATQFTLTVNTLFDFSISASPSSKTIFQTESASYTVTVTLLSGSTRPVTLSTSGTPPGASSSLIPGSGSPTFSSTLTIATTSSTPPTTSTPPYTPYTITVTGTGGGVTHTTTVSLAVNSAGYIIKRAGFIAASVDVGPVASGPQGYVTLLVKFGDLSTTPHDASFYNDMIYGSTGNSVNAYFLEDSYGSFPVTGQVFGDWRTLSKVPDGANDRAHFLTGGASGTCGPNDDGSCLSQLLSHVIATFLDVNFNDFTQGINVELNDNIGSMAWGSIGPIDLHSGSVKRSVTFMAPVYQTPGFHGHEMGHGLRWVHSGLDYDDPWSQMSAGTEYPCASSPNLTCPAHSHGEEKEEQGWIPPTSILTISSPDMTINLMRLETLSNGTMLVKVPISCTLVPWSTGGSCTLYLENRMRYGFDSNLPDEGVVITKYASQGSKNEDGEWLLRPVRTAAWHVGEQYSEGDVKVSVLGSGAGYFTVQVQAASLTTTAPKPPGGCLIATATYGSELAPEVQLLRDFRDNSIMKTAAGSSFMIAFNAWYYSFSPYVAAYLASHWAERTIMKGVLYPLIGMLYLTSQLYSTTAYPELAALLSGLLASSLIGAFYLGLPLSLIRARVRRLRGIRAQSAVLKLLTVSLIAGLVALVLGEILASPIILMLSSATVVLSTLLLSAAGTSWQVAKRLPR